MSRRAGITPEEFRRRARDNDWDNLDGDRPPSAATRIEFTVPGIPRPKARPRVTGHGAYTPQRSVTFEERVALCFKIAAPRHEPWTCPVALGVTAYGAHHAADADNILKSVSDALNRMAYRDDVQVQRTQAEKLPVDDKGPRTVVVVMRIDPAAGLREQWKEEHDAH